MTDEEIKKEFPSAPQPQADKLLCYNRFVTKKV